MSTFTDADSATAKEMTSACLGHFQAGGAAHPGTVIGATARREGANLFRSFPLGAPGLQLGQAVLSTEANEQARGLIRIVSFGFIEGAKTAPDPVRIHGGTTA